MDSVYQFLQSAKNWLNIPLVQTDKTSITLWSVLYLVVLLFLLFYISGKVRDWLANKLLAEANSPWGCARPSAPSPATS